MSSDEFTIARRPVPLDLGQQSPYLVVLTGQYVGRVFKLGCGTYVLGRAVDCDICLPDDGVSRNHARMTLESPEVVRVEDLGSKNGTFVNGMPVTHRMLVDGDRIQVGSTTILKFSMQDIVEEQFQSRLLAAATRDPLTDLPNRRVFEEQLVREVSYANRHATPLSLMAIDLDHFKRINDTYGHPAGDEVLRAVATILRTAVRVEDAVSRVGGEEFAGLLRHSNLAGAVAVAERLRSKVARHVVEHNGNRITVTLSIGLAEYDPSRHADTNVFIAEADQRLYRAKQAGRNRVCID